MSDQEEWSEEPTVPSKKKGLPGWLMFCGGGCLIAVILAAIAGYFLYGEIGKMMDPDEQWARLEEATDLDARPPELTLMFGWSLGINFWMLEDSRGYIAVIYDFGEAEADGRDELFSEDFAGGGLPGLNKIEDPVVGEISVQGRTIQVVRFLNQGGFNPGGGSEVSGASAASFIDITPEDDPGFQMVFLMRNPRSADAKVSISDETIQAFLEPFVIGPDREVYVVPVEHDHGPSGTVEEELDADMLEPPSDDE